MQIGIYFYDDAEVLGFSSPLELFISAKIRFYMHMSVYYSQNLMVKGLFVTTYWVDIYALKSEFPKFNVVDRYRNTQDVAGLCKYIYLYDKKIENVNRLEVFLG